MSEITVDIDFLRNNKVGTQCGSVGNTCFNNEQVLELIEKFIDKIELVEYDEDYTELADFMEDHVYVLPSANVTFKENIKLEGALRIRLGAYYANYYDGDDIDVEFRDDRDIIGEILMMKIGDAGGSWRYDACIEDNVVYFETE